MESEPTYTVFVHIPYEGMHDAFQGTEAEIIEWLKDEGRDYYLDDMSIYLNAWTPDIYALGEKAGR